MTIVVEPTVYKDFREFGIKESSAKAFAHMIAYSEKLCPKFDPKIRAKLIRTKIMSKDEKVVMENPQSLAEWALMAMTYEGKLVKKIEKKIGKKGAKK